ncbi:acetoin dehydrogenase : Alcohol dehydrogenase superfamily, zinc-containing OS=Rhodopseudomonas palustris (strain HaA2) GN=RPB_3806 PE=3 SV=1: ADH_N: ADH_zinc_N [Gemmata massiliana]|uniref:Enoyl reductase (ER) domain-containing protein n=1 Tax=Gemmata massiliana TaxID=1210884 RepID=A0A6P2CYA8_9BACT|nr:zinc-binding dehydrogenase [Gemmata massiliana]VTR93883.1 acetoin dehydrogenase : Alcohol dehydrogenase superfamily, zinc-containing OS=Rhodopseudomonas palustris (strain HaA2) GN=RPB_3806 PE=3 SV=1: ADH_N: ADH_zinc_N [Gemmata massiliana]
MHTDAAVLVELNQPLRLLPLDLPDLKPGQVLVDVAYSGVCHSQLHEVRGRRGPDRFLPHTLGHEGSGTVTAVGPGVAKVRPGDRVVLTWIKGEGADVPSVSYESVLGRVNSGALSTFMRRTVTCENRLVPVPAEMPLREAALLGCALPTGAGVVTNTANPPAGSALVVFGAGGIGLSAVMAARLHGVGTLIAVDVVEQKLADARRFGATHTVNACHCDPVAAILELTGGRGADFAVEAAGRRETMEAAFRCVRDKGGLCVLAGNLPHGEQISLNPFDLIRGKRIVGTWGGDTVSDRDLPRYARLFLDGKLPLTDLISREYPLSGVNAALDDLEGGRVARALIDMGA